MSPAGYTEDALVEQPAIDLLAELGWEPCNAYQEFDHGASTLGRETKAEVILKSRLREALLYLNPEAPSEAIQVAMEELCRDRSRLSAVAANQEVYQLLKNGVRVSVPDPDGEGETVEAGAGHRLGEPGEQRLPARARSSGSPARCTRRRADLVGFVNGLPLRLHRTEGDPPPPGDRLHRTTCGTTSDTIPQLFWYNALIILSNGSQSRDRQHHRGLGALRRVEADRHEGEEGRRLAGDHDPGHLRARRGCWIWSRTSPSSGRCRAGWSR